MTTTHRTSIRCALAIAAAAVACGQPDAEVEQQDPAPPPPAASAAQPAPTGAVDEALVATGEQLFQSKGCLGCHTIGGGRLTGPDLAGVTTRREYGWIVAMVTNPDSMLREDPVARELFAEYMTPMLSVGATPDDARAIYEFLRRDAN